MTTFLTLRSTSTFLLACCLSTGGAFAQTSQDFGADWTSMFDSSGTISPSGYVELVGGAPPVLGTTTSMQLIAPGFQFGFIAVSPIATTGSTVHIGVDPLELYIDPFLTLGTYALPMPGGQAQLDLPLPPDPNLAGLELAFQGLVIDQQGNLAAANLLAGNFGVVPGGPVFFNFQFGGNSGISIDAGEYWEKNNNRQTVIRNATAGPKDYTLCIEKQASRGVLEIRNGAGVVIATIAGHETSTSVSITVPAGGTIHFFNSGNAKINNLKWSVKVD
ncbi:MAG: hypothetical protein NXI31_01310 [bacterium]|nr:hypothetical protein [bacterium]